MAKKLLKVLRMISRDLREGEGRSEDEKVENMLSGEPDLYDIGEELAALEASERLDEEELDVLRSLIAYILMREKTYDREEVYSMVFGGGRRIIWN